MHNVHENDVKNVSRKVVGQLQEEVPEFYPKRDAESKKYQDLKQLHHEILDSL